MLTQLELLVPPLCERAEDLPALLDMSIEKYSTLYRKYVHLSPEARAALVALGIVRSRIEAQTQSLLDQAAALEEDFFRVLSVSKEITSADCKSGFLRRFFSDVLRIFAPLM